jgi:hypothetical protein
MNRMPIGAIKTQLLYNSLTVIYKYYGLSFMVIVSNIFFCKKHTLSLSSVKYGQLDS